MTVFTNSGAISIGPNTGGSSPYPSEITVSGMTGTVTSVIVTLTGLTHTFNADIEAVLQAPDTAKYTMLMGDCGQGGSTTTPVTLVFDQTATASLPSVGTPFVSGTYKPTNVNFGSADTNLTSPAPGASPLPYAANLDTFFGTSPNGVWKLFVDDDGAGDGGSIASGWSIDITTSSGSSEQTVTASNLRIVNRLPSYSISQGGVTAGIKQVLKTVGAASNVNLSSLGTLDWWKYGITPSVYDTTAKGSVARLIHGAFTIVPGFNADGNSAHTFQWSDGAPIASGSSNARTLRSQGTVGSGWELSVDCSSSTRKLTLFCTTFSCTSLLTVSLSDGASADVTDSVVSTNGVATVLKYEIEFDTPTVGATLDITYEITSIPGVTTPYLELSASTLEQTGGNYTTLTGNDLRVINRITSPTLDNFITIINRIDAAAIVQTIVLVASALEVVNHISSGSLTPSINPDVTGLVVVNRIDSAYITQDITLSASDLRIINRLPSTYVQNSGSYVTECTMPYTDIINLALSYADCQDPEVIAKMDMFLRIVESRLNKTSGVQRQMGVMDIRYALGYQEYSLPGDYNSVGILKHVYNYTTEANAVSYTYMPYKDNLAGTFNGTSGYLYSIMGRSLLINVIPDQNMVDNDLLQLKYFTRLRPLTPDNLCNWVAANFPDCYVFGLLVEISSFKKDKTAAALWNERYLDSVDGIHFQDIEYRWNGPSLTTRIG